MFWFENCLGCLFCCYIDRLRKVMLRLARKLPSQLNGIFRCGNGGKVEATIAYRQVFSSPM